MSLQDTLRALGRAQIYTHQEYVDSLRLMCAAPSFHRWLGAKVAEETRQPYRPGAWGAHDLAVAMTIVDGTASMHRPVGWSGWLYDLTAAAGAAAALNQTARLAAGR